MNKNLIRIPTEKMSKVEWLEYRKNGLGASEIGAVMGLSQYKSSLELFYEKINPQVVEKPETMATFMGHKMEDLIAEMWTYWDKDELTMIQNYRDNNQVRKMQKVNAYVSNPDYPHLFVSLDRKINKFGNRGEGTLELKTISSFEAKKWEAEIPPQYIIQVMTQMLVCGFEYGEIAILQDGRKLDVLPLEFNQNIANQIIEETSIFWERVLKGRELFELRRVAEINNNTSLVQEIEAQIHEIEPPSDGSQGFENYMKGTYRISNNEGRNGTILELDHAQKHKEAKQQIKYFEEQARLSQNFLMNEMREVETLDFGKDGKVTWKTNKNGTRIFKNSIK